MSEPDHCQFVESYLGRFESGTSDFEHDSVSDHVKLCSTCYDRMSSFFRVLEVPETGYLQETLDDLTLSIYNLAKALMRQEPPEDSPSKTNHDNVIFVTQPEDAQQYVAQGVEITEDVQDFTGKDEFRGESMDRVRNLIENSRREIDLILSLLDRGIELAGRYSWDCHNLKGILLVSDDRLDDAAREFRAVIAAPKVDAYLRSVQVHAMNNLSFLCSQQGQSDDAIRWAQKSCAFAEEVDMDTFSSRFGLMFFHLRRQHEGDIDRAAEQIGIILQDANSRSAFERCLGLESNAEVRRMLAETGLDKRFGLVGCDQKP